MNDAVRSVPHETAASRQDRPSPANGVDSLSADRASGGLHNTLCSEYAAMLLAMNSGFSALIWTLRLPGTPAAGGFMAISLWICLRSVGLLLWKSTAVPLSASAVLLGGLLTANEWGECPTWLTWSPFSPLAVTLMAAAVLLHDLAVKDEYISNAHDLTERDA
jgi:hypothetical protein